jgi:hypothetical protein
MTILVALTGADGAGKTEAALQIMRQLDKLGMQRGYSCDDYLNYSLAYPLKYSCYNMFEQFGMPSPNKCERIDHQSGLRIKDTKCVTINDKTYTPREIWIERAETIRAMYGDDFFVQHCLSRIDRYYPEVAIIDDARPRDLPYLREAGAMIVRVKSDPCATCEHADISDSGMVSGCAEWRIGNKCQYLDPKDSYGIGRLATRIAAMAKEAGDE